jgi:hypothetical protein
MRAFIALSPGGSMQNPVTSPHSYAAVVNQLGTAHERYGEPDHPMSILMQAGEAALEDVIRGCSHRDRKVRKYCFGILDHYADDRCGSVIERGLRDPASDVRRWAAHAISCQMCKPKPLRLDVAGLLLGLLLNDPSILVRRVAACYLSAHAGDSRVVTVLRRLLVEERDARLRSRMQHALAQAAAR